MNRKIERHRIKEMLGWVEDNLREVRLELYDILTGFFEGDSCMIGDTVFRAVWGDDERGIENRLYCRIKGKELSCEKLSLEELIRYIKLGLKGNKANIIS
jgi:hypothetical protein